MKNIAVVGAGITGILSAYYLAKEGNKVTVFEQERYPAMRTSFANGGQISVSNSEVWNTWSNVWKGIKWLTKEDAPLLIRPRPDWDKIKWLSKFIWHTFNQDYESNTLETIKLGLESRIEYKNIVDTEKLKFDQSYCGILHIYKDKKYFEQAQISKNIYDQGGCEWTIVNTDEIGKLEHSLKFNYNLVGGTWTKDDWVGDIHKFCFELAEILQSKYRVLFNYKSQVDLKRLQKDFDVVVISAGIGSIELARSVGDSLPLYPVKGYSITVELDDELSRHSAPQVSILDDEAKIVCSRLGNRLRVAGTAELAGENYDIRRDRVEPLLRWVHNNFPKVNTHNYSSWACLRPMTPNMMPIVKFSERNPKIVYHTGHGHLGWTISPATAKHLTKLVTNR